MKWYNLLLVYTLERSIWIEHMGLEMDWITKVSQTRRLQFQQNSSCVNNDVKDDVYDYLKEGDVGRFIKDQLEIRSSWEVTLILSESGRWRLLLSPTLFDGCQHVLLLSNIKTTFLPRILKMERTEVVSQTSFPGSYDGHQAKVFKLLCRINGAIFPWIHQR